MTKEEARHVLKTKYLCTVNPFKRKVFDPKRGKQIHLPNFTSGMYGRRWPLIGFVCDKCGQGDNFQKHYMIDEGSLCESCAINFLMTGGG